MPICEADPWRLQYFEHAACPPGREHPDRGQRRLALVSGAPLGLRQDRGRAEPGLRGPARTACRRRAFPYSPSRSPISRAWAIGSRILHSQAEYEQSLTPGHMWMTLLDGRHVSSDVAVVDGEPRWWRHVTGRPGGEGTFDYWTVHAAAIPAIEDYCGAWIREHLAGYTGILNTETIGGRMIEVHLRLSDQWPDLYGAGWVDALVRLYHERRWDFADAGSARRIQRRAVRSAWPVLSPPAAGTGRAGAPYARRVERAGHVPRGQGTRAARHAAGRLPARRRERLEPAGRYRRARDLRTHFLARAA